METFKISDTVGAIVTRHPGLSRVFEEAGIDYCCGGKRPLETACREKGINPQVLLGALVKFLADSQEKPSIDVASMSLTELVDHIEGTHHAFLHAELPRLDFMTQKVLAAHGEGDARLSLVRDIFAGLSTEMTSHMRMEEQVLFPLVRGLDSGLGSEGVADKIHQLESEHDAAGAALARLRELTDGYTPPSWACNTYRAMLDLMARLEYDLHQHVHKENNILFPRALKNLFCSGPSHN